MNKQQLLFLALIVIICYLLYLILIYKYHENDEKDYINKVVSSNLKLEYDNEYLQDRIEYLDTEANKGKRAKEEQGRLDPGEVVLVISDESQYNKFTKEDEELSEIFLGEKEDNKTDGMTMYEKWMYYLFSKDLR